MVGDKLGTFHGEELKEKRRILFKKDVKGALRPWRMLIGLWSWTLRTRTPLTQPTLIFLLLCLSSFLALLPFLPSFPFFPTPSL